MLASTGREQALGDGAGRVEVELESKPTGGWGVCSLHVSGQSLQPADPLPEWRSPSGILGVENYASTGNQRCRCCRTNEAVVVGKTG